MENHEDDNDSVLSFVPENIDSLLQWSPRVFVPWELFSGQIAYGSGLLLKADGQDKKGLSGRDQKSANYGSMGAAKSHQHTVFVLCILNSNVDNKSPDEPASLKESMARNN